MALEDDIDFHLKMENDWSDSAGNISDGTANGASFVADDPVGDYSGLLDGTNDRVVYTDEPILNPGLNDFTYAGIVKLSKIGVDQHFFDKGYTTSKRIRFGLLSSNLLFATIGTTVYTSTISLSDISNFHLVTLSVDRNSGNSFFQLDSTFDTFNPIGSSAIDLDTISDLVIGARSDQTTNYLGARISQFTKWNRFLSQAEGTEYYNSGAFLDLLAEGVPSIGASRSRLINLGGNLGGLTKSTLNNLGGI